MFKKAVLIFFVLTLSLTCNVFAEELNFGDGSSKTLTSKAWSSLQVKNYDDVIAFADKCVASFSKKALEQQASLTGFAPNDEASNYWALNDVGTCLFIKGKALKEQGKKEEAKKVFQNIINNYKFSQCYDSGGWFWKIADGANDEILGIDKGVDFGNMKSETLASKGWEALNAKAYEQAVIYADKCVSVYGEKAKEMQAALKDFASKEKAFDYWALNDVGTCLFIKGKALQAQGKKEDAKKIFQNIIDNYKYAQAWDVQGWFWKVADASKDAIQSIESGVDFGNMTSEVLVAKAWEALGSGKYAEVNTYVEKALTMYSEKAGEMQKSLNDFAPKEKAFDYWALNDVGTALFIKAKALQSQGKSEDAKKVFQTIIDNYSYAQAWDPQGWFWKPAEAAQDQFQIMESGIDFGDYTSETLTGKAWEAFSTGDYDASILYAKKCHQLYRKNADDMQAKLEGYAPKEKAFDYWALNDVGTCYFIIGEAFMAKNDAQKALEAYKTLVDKYYYSQCWDPKGWFWKPAVAARGKVNKIAAEKGLMY